MSFIPKVKQIFNNKIFWLLFCLIGINLVYLHQFSLTLKGPVLIDSAGNRTGITLPYLQKMPAGEYVISGKVFYRGFFNARLVQIIPDDTILSIRVNGRDVPLHEVNPTALSDRVNGFHFNLGRYLQKGDNNLEIRIYNGEGLSGVYFHTSPYHIGHWILLILILAIGYLVLSRFIPNKVLILILLAGFLIRVTYYWVTPYNIRECDVDGHNQYIHYIVDTGSLPDRHYGWETYQPPFYYITAALVYKTANLLGVNGAYYLYRVLQFFSLILFMGFLLAALLIFQFIFSRLSSIKRKTKKSGAIPESGKVQKNDWFIAVMFGLLAFWPTAIIHSVRIGNDVMFYFLYAWGLYFLIKWYHDLKDRNLFISFILTTLCFITKSNAIVLYGIFGIVYLLKLWQKRMIKRYLIKTGILLVVFSMGVLITFGAGIEEKLKGSSYHLVVPNIADCDYSPQVVGNKLENYIYFDLQSFINEPYVYPWEEKGARSLFWNYHLKTGLISEFRFDAPFHQRMTFWITLIFLGMVLFFLVGLVIILRMEFKKHLILFLNLFLLSAAAVLFRISIPLSCSQEFRYIFPQLISFCFFYGYTLYFCRRRGWIRFEMIGHTLAFLFIGASALFFIGMHFV